MSAHIVQNVREGNSRKREPTMKSDLQAENVPRESVLKLLSDDEVASVSTAETAARLLDGEEYFDLEQLDRGVQQATMSTTVMGHVLPRRAVHKDTWSTILTLLGLPKTTTDGSKSQAAKHQLSSRV
jgi:hypothetical protein